MTPTALEFATPAAVAFLALASLGSVLRARRSSPSPASQPEPREAGSGGGAGGDPGLDPATDPGLEPPPGRPSQGTAEATPSQGKPGLEDRPGSPADPPGPAEPAGTPPGDDQAPGRERVEGEDLVRAWYRAAYARYGQDRR